MTSRGSRNQRRELTDAGPTLWEGNLHYGFPSQIGSEGTAFPLVRYLPSTKSGKPPIFEITGSDQTFIEGAGENLNPDYLDATSLYLKNDSGLVNRVAVQLSQQFVTTYRDKIALQRLNSSKKLVETELPYFEVIPDSPGHSVKIRTNLDGDALLNPIYGLIQELFEKNDFWSKSAKEIWSSLIVWAIEDIQVRIGESAFAELTPDEFNQTLYQFIFEQDPAPVHNRLIFLEDFYSQSITRHIVEDLDLPNYPLSGLEMLLGLRSRKDTKTSLSTEVQLSRLDTVAAIPTGLPIVSSISAQLQAELWKPDASGVAHFRYHSKSNHTNYLEHYITSPGDIEALPWEAAEQIINKFGFNTVKLQFIFAAYAMRQARPWESTFTLKATDIIEELGWDKNHSTNLPTKRNEVASIAYALSCLLVKAVWIEGRGKTQVDASTPIGRMWEVLLDPHGQFDWTTGRIDQPDEVYITVRPGLWTAHFLNQAGSKAKEALYQFGYLALNILKLDPYHDELTLRLAIHLTLDVRIRARDRNPYEYRVKNLIEAVLPESLIQEARQSSEKARSLFNRWNKALKLLASLGWHPEDAETIVSVEEDPTAQFYVKPYPEWLDPNTKIKKPRGWLEVWLEQKMVIQPPEPIPSRMAVLKGAGKPQSKKLKLGAGTPLTGELVRSARKEKGWTQAKLAGTLDVHQSLVAKIESGDRPISPQLETSLRRVLGL